MTKKKPDFQELLRNAAHDLPMAHFQPLKVKLVRPEIQARIDEYRSIRSLMP